MDNSSRGLVIAARAGVKTRLTVQLSELKQQNQDIVDVQSYWNSMEQKLVKAQISTRVDCLWIKTNKANITLKKPKRANCFNHRYLGGYIFRQ